MDKIKITKERRNGFPKRYSRYSIAALCVWSFFFFGGDSSDLL